MNPSAWGRLLGAAITSLLVVACGASVEPTQVQVEPRDGHTPAEPPDENAILVQELPHIVERSGLYSLPSDPDQVLEALATLPNGLGDIIAMHVGRYYPTPHEFTPGKA